MLRRNKVKSRKLPVRLWKHVPPLLIVSLLTVVYLLFVLTVQSRSQEEEHTLLRTATALPASLSITKTSKVFSFPVEMDLSTEGLVHTSNLTGSFRYQHQHAPLCTTSDSCTVHFPPVDEHHDFVLLTKKGDKSALVAFDSLPNQDRSVMMQSHHNQHKLIALFDGHGEHGHIASEAVALELPFELFNSLQNAAATEIPTIITETFFNVDRGIVSQLPEGGTTAVILYQNENSVYLASAGDSTAFCAIYQNDKALIVLEAVKHKPGDISERKRIESLGGQVIIPSRFQQSVGASSRVVIPTPDGLDMALAMSRCFGDEAGKKLHLLIVEPSVVSVPIQPNMYCMAISDGLVDFVPVAKIADILGKALYGGEEGRTLPSVSREMIETASDQWSTATGGTYRDDISLIVTKIT
jgi:serine/threonine protein phosphatase PrpC